MLSKDHERLLVKVSRFYYEQELTQSEISKRLRISRQKVQRLLKQAKDQGIVQVTIRPVIGAFPDLERKLENRFGLQEAVVIETTNFEDQFVVAREVGVGAADYMRRVIKPQDSIVVSWGGSLLGMVNALSGNVQRSDLDGIKVIQGLGGLGDPNKEVHAADLTRRLAQVFGGEAVLLPTPAVAGSREARDTYIEDPFVSQILKQAQSADMAVMGIGAPRLDSILMREGKIVTVQDLENLQQNGAVGDINLRFFDVNGEKVLSNFDQRVIGLTIDEIQRIERLVGVAGGAAKLSAIQGALAGNLLDVLVTDHITAKRVL
jgi:DNA-binding transcriptional regulator LsrR (DeoR family)